MSVTAAFTNFNRTELLFEAIDPFLNDDRINEIVISDDHSEDAIYNTIVWKYNGIEKVKIFRNETNLDCYRNKRMSVKRSTSDWVLILDSDNIFSRTFIDNLFAHKPWDYSTVYAPEFAEPHFNFTALAGTLLSSDNIAQFVDIGSCTTMLNAMNYFVNREEFLRLWDGSIDPVTSDSLYHNYKWLKGGNNIYVVPGLRYSHRIHEGSHYRNNVKRTPQGFHDSLIERLKQMR